MLQQKNSVLRWANRLVSGTGASAVAARDSLRRLMTTMHHALMIAGIAALTALGVFYFNPQLAEEVVAMSPFATEEQETTLETAELNLTPAPTVAALAAAVPAAQAVNATPVATAPSKQLLSQPEQARVTSWISKRYRVASDAATMLVGATYATAREIHLDPLLILAVMAIESRFNPFAESPVGAQGLMQVMSKVHKDKFQSLGGVQAALNPVANIKVGSLILKDYVKQGGSVEAGLKMYVGAGDAETDSGYGSKVLAEYHKLKAVAKGKDASAADTKAVGNAARTNAKAEKRAERTDRSERTQEARNEGNLAKVEPA